MKFYTYEHVRLDTNQVFYVGKGCGKRAYTKGKNRSVFWNNVVAKANGYEVKLIAKNIDEELAFLVEAERIDQLKRLNVELVNLTEGGGGGIKGHKHSEETKKKMSVERIKKYKKENHPRFGKFGKDNPMYGRKQSEEAKRKISENCSMKRPEVLAKIRDENHPKAQAISFNGKTYKTIKEMGVCLGINVNTIRVRIHRNAEKWGYKLL